jgi:hypothetical protein
MYREPLLLPCAPALVTADTLLLGAANADNYDTYEQRASSPAAVRAARQSSEGADDEQCRSMNTRDVGRTGRF